MITNGTGPHRVIAQAYVDTQLGRRLVGTFDRTLTVDPRAPGWTIHFFFPSNFRDAQRRRTSSHA